MTEATPDDAKDRMIAARLTETRSTLDDATDWTLAANQRANALNKPNA
jgi:hypothetical protein